MKSTTSFRNPLRALLRKTLPALAAALVLAGAFSCTQSPDEITELEFNLPDSLVGAYDSVRVAVYPDGQTGGDPLFEKTLILEEDQSTVRLKLPKDMPENFTTVLTGFENGAIVKRTRYDYDTQADNPVSDPVALNPDPDAEEVSLEADDFECQVGDSASAPVRIVPSDWPDQDFSLASENEDAVTVQDQTVYCHEVGESEITATLEDASVTFTVQVKEKVVLIASFGVKDLGVVVGQTVEPEISIEPEDATSTGYDLSVEEGDAAEIDGDGKIRGVKAGEATIRVKATQGEAEATFKVTVSDEEVLAESFSAEDVAMPVYGTLEPEVTPEPSGATERGFNLESEDTTVVRIVDGKLNARRLGQTTVRIRAEKGEAEGSFEVTVRLPMFTEIQPVTAQWCGNCHAPGRTFNLQDSLVLVTKGAEAMRRLSLDIGDSARMPLDTVMDEDPKNMLLAWLGEHVHPVVGVEVAELTVAVGDSARPEVTFDPENATNRNFTLESDNPSFAKIVGGQIVGVAEGETDVKLVTEDGKREKTFRVKVVRPEFEAHIKPITAEKCGECHGPAITFDLQDSLTLLAKGKEAIRRIQLGKGDPDRMPAGDNELTESELTMLLAWLQAYFVPLADISASDVEVRLGETLLPAITFTPANASNRGYTLTSLDSAIASSPDGVRLTGRDTGTATIFLASEEGPLNRSFKAKVVPWLPDSIVGRDTAVGVGDSVRLTIQVYPAQATVKEYTLSSLARVFQLNSATGFVTGLQEGTGAVVVRSAADSTILDSVFVTVANIVDESISVNDTSLLVGSSATPIIQWNPPNSTNKNFTLAVKSGSAVSIKGTLVVGEEAGEAVVTVTSEEGGNSADFTVTVGNVVATDIALKVGPLAAGASVTATATFTPTNTTQKTFTLTSLTPSVLSVSGTSVTALKLGTGNVVATAADGVKDTLSVTTIMPPFQGAVRNVISAKCNTCHSIRASNLLDSATAYSYGAQVYDRINRTPGTTGYMPQSGTMTKTDLATLNNWFKWRASPVIVIPPIIVEPPIIIEPPILLP